MWSRIDNQDVGLEAAIIQRVRNSSLVKWFCAEDPTGLKLGTEATGLSAGLPAVGRAGSVPCAAQVDRKDGWSARECECRHE